MSTQASSPVGLAIDGHIATLTMQDPAKRNALGAAMLDGLTRAFQGLAGQDIRAVVLRARPEDRVWCATDERRATEVDVAVHALNRMSEVGRPSCVRTA